MNSNLNISTLYKKNGIALLYAIIFIGVVMTLTILTQNIVLKLIVSGRTERRGVYAYYAADAAVGCIRYLDGYYLGYEMGDQTLTAGFMRHRGEPAYCYGLGGSLSNVEEASCDGTNPAETYCAFLLVPSPKSALDTNKRCAIVKMKYVNNTTIARTQDVLGADICANGTSGSLLDRIKTASIPVLRILFRRQ